MKRLIDAMLLVWWDDEQSQVPMNPDPPNAMWRQALMPLEEWSAENGCTVAFIFTPEPAGRWRLVTVIGMKWAERPGHDDIGAGACPETQRLLARYAVGLLQEAGIDVRFALLTIPSDLML